MCPMERALRGTLPTSCLRCSQEWGEPNQTWKNCPFPLALGLRATEDICAPHLSCGYLFHPVSAIFLRAFRPERSQKVTLKLLSGPRVTQPIYHTSEQGDQGLRG